MFDPVVRLMDDAGLMPHGICFAWRPDLLIIHAGADVVITLAYFLIPLALVSLVRQRTDIVHGWMLYTFAAFILLCGLTHLSNLYVLWIPDYALQGLLKIATAVVSIATAIALWRLLPHLIALPTQRQLVDANDALVREVAERTAAETTLKERTLELEASNGDLERFTYVASHDLRAPLRGVRSVVGWLEEDLQGSLTDNTRKYMQLITSRVERLEQMLSDLLEYSRSARSERADETFDSDAIVRTCFEDLNTDERFELVVATPLPVVTGSRIGFERIVANLIGNAIKHHDQPRGTLTVAASKTGRAWRFTVGDDGPGIPERFHEKIFGMFETLSSRDSKETSGLGLAIVKKILAAAGGSISIIPGTGRGTVFAFDWPITSETSEAA